ncbi:MAG: tetratricopeptide repeat protein [bacterium]
MLALVSLGQKPLVSDLLTIGVVQYFGRPRGDRDAVWESRMLDVATDLDPRNFHAWYITSHLMSFTPEEITASVQVLANGIVKNPTEWRIPFWLSLKYYGQGNYAQAQHYAEIAAGYPDAPRHVQRFPSFLYQKAGDVETAIEYLKTLYESAATPDEKDFILKRIGWIEARDRLQRAVNAYRERFQTLPLKWDDLVTAGVLSRIPGDPFERGFRIKPSTGEVESK